MNTDNVSVKFGYILLDKLPPDEQLNSPPVTPKFLADIEQRGVLIPIVLTEEDNGSFVVRAGRRRIKALRAAHNNAKEAGKKGHDLNRYAQIQAITYSGLSAKEKVAISWSENEHRSENMITDVLVVRDLLHQNYSFKEIAKFLNVSITRVKKIDQEYGKLPNKFFDLLKEGKIAPGTAKAAAKISPNYQKELLKIAAKTGKIVKTDIKAVKQKVQRDIVQSLPLGDLEHDMENRPGIFVVVTEKPNNLIISSGPLNFKSVKAAAKKFDEAKIFKLVEVDL